MSDKRFKGVLIGLGAVTVIVAAGYGAYASQTSAQLIREREAIKAVGGILDSSELNRKIPVESNAAGAYRKAFGSMQLLLAKDERQSKILDSNESIDGETVSVAERAAALKNAEVTLQRFRDAAKFPDCAFSREANGNAVGVPEFEEAPVATRLLMTSARGRAEAGDFKGAISEIQTALAMSTHFGRERTLGSQLVAAGIRNRILAECMSLVGEHEQHPKFLNEIAGVLDSFPSLPDLRTYVVYEPAFGQLATKRFRSDPEKWLNAVPAPEDQSTEERFVRNFKLVKLGAVQDAMEAKLLARYRALIEAAPRSVDDLGKAGIELLKIDQLREEDRTWQAWLATRTIPSYNQIPTSLTRTVALSRCVSLLALIAATPPSERKVVSEKLRAERLDPFSGKPLLVKLLDDSIIVYSVGPNLQDDGGGTSFDRGAGDVVARSPNRRPRVDSRFPGIAAAAPQ